jgi:hypothetical protein
MRVLLDNCVDVGFKPLIFGHDAGHALDFGWGGLSNGKLIEAAEGQSFDALITVDKGLQHQQSLAGRKLSVITLAPRFVTLDEIAPLAPQVLQALVDLPQGVFLTIGP